MTFPIIADTPEDVRKELLTSIDRAIGTWTSIDQAIGTWDPKAVSNRQRAEGAILALRQFRELWAELQIVPSDRGTLS